MTESATLEPGLREERRRRTERAIHLCALRRAEAAGLDGFTLEDLAADAGVSRRTLFNYFPSKLDAVLGPEPELPEEDLAAFLAGGPSGDLVEDTIALARPLLDAHALSADEVALARRVVTVEPRLHAAAHARFEDFSQRLTERVGDRPGSQRLDPAAARLLVTVFCAVHDVAMLSLSRPDGPHTSVADAFADHLRALRRLLAGA